MPITAKELMQPPKFEGLGKFVYSRAASGEWAPTFTFEFFGGQVSVEVEESEILNPPAVGSMFFISGFVRRSHRNGSITLAATDKKFVVADPDNLSVEQMEQFIGGLRIRGVGVVVDKQATTIGRQLPYLSATLRWQGATHQFKKLTPEIYQRVPSKGHVRFELNMRVREERNTDGQLIVLQIPSLELIQSDTLQSGSTPAAGGTSVGGTPTSGTVSGGVKPAGTPTSAPAPGAKV